jgi:hypothetical protein
MTDADERMLAEMRNNPRGVRFAAAKRVATVYFGQPRRSGSHHVFRMPWPGDPRVNLQEATDGKAKAYQVRQLLAAIDRLEVIRAEEGEHGTRQSPTETGQRVGKPRRRN